MEINNGSGNGSDGVGYYLLENDCEDGYWEHIN